MFMASLSTMAPVAHASLRGVDQATQQAFLQAVFHDEIAIVNRSLLDNKSMANVADTQGNTALIWAVAAGHEQMLKQLLAAGAHVNETNILGKTALHYAVEYQRVDMVKWLIEAGAKKNLKDKEGKTALDYAIDRQSLELAQAIDPKSVTVEVNEAGLPIMAVAAAAGGGGAGISTTAVVTGAAVAAGGAGIAVAAGGGGGGNDDKGADSSSGSSSGGGTSSGTGGTSSGGSSSNSKVRVAILDTGVFMEHPDLSIDKSLSFNTQTGEHDATPDANTQELEQSHGTIIAGIIAAQKNSSGIKGLGSGGKGIAPKSEIIAIRLPLSDSLENMDFNQLGVSLKENITAGILYAIGPKQTNASILNHSWGVFDQWIPAYAFDRLGCNVSPPSAAPALCSNLYQPDPKDDAAFLVPNQGLKTFLEEGKKIFQTLPEAEKPSDVYQSMRDILEVYKVVGATNKIIVWAAGNSGAQEVQVDARIPFMEAATDNPDEFKLLQKNWLVVVALSGKKGVYNEPSESLADYSNQCGIAKSRCLAALGDAIAEPIEPGARYVQVHNNETDEDWGGIVSQDFKPGNNEELIWDTTGYAVAPGTSFAAPRVSGALSLLLQQSKAFRENPTLAADWLLQTADRSFKGYDDTKYGQGILDIDKALAPNPKKLMIATKPSTSGNSQLFAQSRLILGAATGDALAKEKLSFGIVDMYQRFYQVGFNAPVYHRDLQDRFSDFTDDALQHKQSINEHMQLAMSVQDPHPDLNETTHRSVAEMESVQLESQDRNTKWALSFDNQAVFSDVQYNVAFDKAFGFSALDPAIGQFSASEVAGRNGFLGFADTGMSVMSGYRDTASGRSFRMGGFLYNSADEVETITSGKKASNSGMVAEVTQVVGNATRLGLQVGVLHEKNTFLGSYTSGAFSVARDTPTWFSAVAAEYALTENTHLFATYSAGLSKPVIDNQSLVEEVSDIVSDSFSVGVTQEHFLQKDDQLGINISQPLRVMSGHAGLKLAEYKDADDNLYYTHHAFSLEPSGREIDGEVYYGMKLSDSIKVKTSLMYRNEPNHIEDAPAETLGLLSVKYTF